MLNKRGHTINVLVTAQEPLNMQRAKSSVSFEGISLKTCVMGHGTI